MHNLITTRQNTKLIQMLNDQEVSINNVEITPPPSPLTDDELFRPFANKYGTKKQTSNFNDWSDFYLDKPREIN